MDPLARNRPLKGKLDWDRFCGPARKQPQHHDGYDNVAFLNWRYFWAFSGGNMTDQGTHLMDVIQWFMNDSKPPLSAVCQGQVYRLQPSETPDTFCAVFTYPRFIATWTLAYTNSYQDSWRITFQGNKASMELDDQGCRVYSDPGRGRKQPQELLHDIKGGLPTEPHVENFLQCIRDRKEPNGTVEIGHAAVAGPHLANLAMKKGCRALLKEDGTVVTGS
jgi:predicted dehydrogenase